MAAGDNTSHVCAVPATPLRETVRSSDLPSGNPDKCPTRSEERECPLQERLRHT